MALHQKLPRPSFKSYINNILLCQVCLLKLKFPWLKIFEVFRPLHLKGGSARPLPDYRTTCDALTRKQCVSIQTVQVQ